MLWEYVYRTIIIYFVVLVVIRLMGKREIGQLSPFDFVVAVIMAEIAAIPMEVSDIPLWHSIVPLLVLGLLEVMLSYATLFSDTLRRFICGEPQLIVKNGKLLRAEMRKARYNLDEFLAQIREKGIVNPDDIEFAVLETSGRLSVVLKSQRRPLTPADLGITTNYEGLPVVLIKDGTVLRDNLHRAGKDEAWLARLLSERGLKPQEVLLCTINGDGNLFLCEK